jgi:methylphosphotriester-DNA--protein-cysteine methyltransferase
LCVIVWLSHGWSAGRRPCLGDSRVGGLVHTRVASTNAGEVRNDQRRRGRFIKATGITPLDYLQRVKVEVAKKSFENKRKTVNEVMYDVGYNDIKAFRDVFGRITGMSPLDYKSKYSKVNL